jgi:eukaryotic-like serine/threonine-protein kinase
MTKFDSADCGDRGLILRIEVTTGPHAGAIVQWNQPGQYLIGRGAHAQLSLANDLTASVEHCRIEIHEHGCVIEDLGSRQGTLVNDRPSTRSLIESGDSILVGMSRLAITLSANGDPHATILQRDLWSPNSATVISDEISLASPSGVFDIPSYTIVRELGAGGMGIVYEAIQRQTRERVAIKTMIPPPGAARHAILMFQREMELLAQLNHDRIVRYIDSGEHAGQIYFVMEYVETIELQKLVDSMPRQRRVEIYCGVICQILEALEYAHKRKLVHRDVKPRNILVSREGRRIMAKLADFGLAKNFELAGLSQLTADDELRGTLAFMPWEQLRDSRYAKPTVDIYSTAATLVYYLTGQTPGHVASSVSAPELLADLPPKLADVLSKALAAKPEDRFASAAEMRAALRPFGNRTKRRG